MSRWHATSSRRRRILGRSAVAGFGLALALVATTPGGATARTDSYDPWPVMTRGTGPAQLTFYAGELYHLTHPGVMPRGVNDPSCRPTKERPRPVLLLPGWVQSAYGTFSRMAAELQADGACVYTFQTGQYYSGLPIFQTGKPLEYARTVAAAVRRIQAQTGADKVDMVAFSQAVSIGLYYVKFLGGRARVDQFVAYSGTPRGMDVFGLISAVEDLGTTNGSFLYSLVPPLEDYDPRGAWVKTLYDRKGPTVPEVRYTTMNNTVTSVVPGGGGLPAAPNVRNIRTVDRCPQAQSSHLGYPYDPVALRVLRNVLGPATAVRPTCRFVLFTPPF